jgi:hypothetical protein
MTLLPINLSTLTLEHMIDLSLGLKFHIPISFEVIIRLQYGHNGFLIEMNIQNMPNIVGVYV